MKSWADKTLNLQHNTPKKYYNISFQLNSAVSAVNTLTTNREPMSHEIYIFVYVCVRYTHIMSQGSIVLIILACECSWALWCHSIFQCLFGHKQTSKSHETYVPYSDSAWNPCNLWFRHILFYGKNPFMTLAGSVFYKIWSGRFLALTIFGKIHFLLTSENEFFYQITCDGIESFIDFMSIKA